MAGDDEQIDPVVAALLARRTDRVEPPVPATSREFHWIAAEEYETYLNPEATLAAMPFGAANRAQLWRELRNGRYKAAADEVIWTHNGKTGRDRLAVLEHWVWTLFEPEIGSDFWTTGYFDTHIPSEDGRYHINSSGWIRVFGTRFLPNAPLPPPPAVAAPEARAEKPTVAKSELVRWHDVFKQVHPDAPEALALRSASAMFPEHHVPRQYVRDLRGPQALGKPKARRE